MAKFDYRELYKDELVNFRGLAHCGRTDVKPMPRRSSPVPKTFRGTGKLRWLKHCDVPDERFDRKQLEKGTDVELEHTDDRAVAKCIAKAHLVESPDYYKELEKMERRLKRRRRR